MASKTVDEYPDCERCPNRIFNTGKYIQGGRGSIHGDIVFLFPRGDRNYCEDYQLFTDIGNLYDEYSGRNNTEDVYMTYSIKCACSNNYNTYLTAIDKCRNILWKELARINYRTTVPCDVLIADTAIDGIALVKRIMGRRLNTRCLEIFRDTLCSSERTEIMNDDVLRSHVA